MAHAPSHEWYPLLRNSLKRNEKSRDSRYFQIATVDADGKPANRTVVYRGFLPTADGRVDENVLTFVTDRRSEKIKHLSAIPSAEVAWYFPITREQYRISGVVHIIFDETADPMLAKARRMAWSNMSDPGRQQFLWPSPGADRTGDDEIEYTNSHMPSKDDPIPSTFCLCCLAVDRVSLLSLKSNEREDFTCADGVWRSRRVNP